MSGLDGRRASLTHFTRPLFTMKSCCFLPRKWFVFVLLKQERLSLKGKKKRIAHLAPASSVYHNAPPPPPHSVLALCVFITRLMVPLFFSTGHAALSDLNSPTQRCSYVHMLRCRKSLTYWNSIAAVSSCADVCAISTAPFIFICVSILVLFHTCKTRLIFANTSLHRPMPRISTYTSYTTVKFNKYLLILVKFTL